MVARHGFGGASSLDIELNGAGYPLVRKKNGALSIAWPDAASEAGTKGRVGTMVFNELHHGIGPILTEDTDRYRLASGASAMRPGRIEAMGALTDVLGGASTQDTGPTETTKIFSSSFQWEGDVYFVLPQSVLKVEGGTGTWNVQPITGMGGADYIRGQAAQYRGDFYFGLEDASGLSVGHLRFDPSTDTWEAFKGAADNYGSMFFSVHTFLWCLQTTFTGKKGSARWKVKYMSGSNPQLDSSFADAMTPRHSPFPTAIYPLGRWLLLFGATGEILSLSEVPPIKALVPPGMMASYDVEFGVGSRMWGENLLIPSRRTLHRISLDEAGPKDWGPAGLQGATGLEQARPSCLAPYGPDMVVGTRSRTDDSVQLLGLREYDDGPHYHVLLTADILTGAHAVRGLEVLSSGWVYFLVGNATEGRIRRFAVSPTTGGSPPSIGTGYVESSFSTGGISGRKLVLGVRGWTEAILPSFYGAQGVNVGVDGLGASTMAPITAQGQFSGAVTHPVGYAFAIRPFWNVVNPDSPGWPVFLGPIYLDYMEIPESGLLVTFDIDAGGEGASPDRRAPLLATLKALEGESVTLKLREDNTTYTVIVAAVEAIDIGPETVLGGDRASIRVTARII